MNNITKIAIITVVAITLVITPLLVIEFTKVKPVKMKSTCVDCPIPECENVSSREFSAYYKNMTGYKEFLENTRDSQGGGTMYGDVSANPIIAHHSVYGENYSSVMTIVHGPCPGDLINMTMKWNGQEIIGQDNIISFFDKDQ